MYQHVNVATVPGLVTAIENFCVSAGFEVSYVAETKLAPGNLNGVYQDIINSTDYLQVTSSTLGNNVNKDTPVNANILTIKDPNSSQTHTLTFYTYGGSMTIHGVGQKGWYMDYRMNQKNLSSLHIIPENLSGADMFWGTTSDGKLWAHFAIEGQAMIYTHFGLGVMEKLLDFTGGDYITAHFFIRITGGSGAGTNTSFLAYGCRSTGGTFWRPPAFYCPDLDEDNKSDPANDYRSMYGTNIFSRTDFELGHTSLYYDSANTGVAYSNAIGGEISINNFPLPNVWSGNSPLFPIIVYARNGKNTTYAGACGYFKGVRAINVANYLPRDEVTLGSDTWMIFPAVAKQGIVADSFSTFNQGYAVLKNG
jgi:hypothetical protein